MAYTISEKKFLANMEARASLAENVCASYGVYSLAYIPTLSQFRAYGWTAEQIGTYRDTYEEACRVFADMCRDYENPKTGKRDPLLGGSRSGDENLAS